jgi:predicted transcriptional regulator
LTRHLSTNGLTPAQYRERYGLKPDYPMTAPAYSEQRRQMAKKIGLGRKPAQKAAAKTK